MRVSGIILSAGESRRMGELKPLLPFAKKTIIETVIDNFLNADLFEIIVVLGYCAEKIQKVISKYPIKIAINENYLNGMLSSVQCGINFADESAEGFLIGLCDQPSIDHLIISKILSQFCNQRNGIILPVHNNKRGHPIIIANRYKNEIFQLDNNIGLRQLIDCHKNDISLVEIESDVIIRDIDFPEDYKHELRVLKK